jgi:retron-type reverse transcriptase
MSQLQALRAASSLQQVATLLGFKPKALAYVLYKKPTATKYQSFAIAKRGGGLRLINSPCPELKLLQRNLSTLLQNCVEEINATKKFEDYLAHAFKRKRSIVSNAEKHLRRKHVFNIDLQDFFGTINFGRVRGFFIKDANFMLDANVATILAQIACHENALPQGSPCSPVISNLIGHVLDIHLCRLATKHGCTYTRYADDITFSTNKVEFPDQIAARDVGQSHIWQPGQHLQSTIARAGFSINLRKTRMQYRTSRQAVTGLVVNKKANVRSDYRRSVRAMAHHLFKTGEFECIKSVAGPGGALTPTEVKGSMEELHGMLGYIDRVDRCHAEKESKEASVSSEGKARAREAEKALRSKQTLYRRFLIFKDLYCAHRPVIVCEGKTDNIYLHYAIKNLAASYPSLANISGGKVTLNVRILKTLDSSIGRVLRLGHGSSDLARLVEDYLSEMKRFTASGMEHPASLLVDNDGGADQVYSAIKKSAKKSISKTDPYCQIVGNLSVVITPLKPGTKESEIEDSFDDTIRKMKLGNKAFSSDPKADVQLHFGKHILSQYVRQNSATIDFSGFAELLSRISAAIEDYYRQRPKAVPAVSAASAANRP